MRIIPNCPWHFLRRPASSDRFCCFFLARFSPSSPLPAGVQLTLAATVTKKSENRRRKTKAIYFLYAIRQELAFRHFGIPARLFGIYFSLPKALMWTYRKIRMGKKTESRKNIEISEHLCNFNVDDECAAATAAAPQ